MGEDTQLADLDNHMTRYTVRRTEGTPRDSPFDSWSEYMFGNTTAYKEDILPACNTFLHRGDHTGEFDHREPHMRCLLGYVLFGGGGREVEEVVLSLKSLSTTLPPPLFENILHSSFHSGGRSPRDIHHISLGSSLSTSYEQNAHSLLYLRITHVEVVRHCREHHPGSVGMVCIRQRDGQV